MKKNRKTKPLIKASIIIALAFAALFTGYKLFFEPAWYVEEKLIPLWTSVIKEAKLPKYPVYPLSKIKKTKPGIIISYNINHADKKESNIDFSNLFPRSYTMLIEKKAIGKGSIPLITDPWVIVRHLKDKSLTSKYFISDEGNNILIAPLKEKDTYNALLAEAAYFAGGFEINSQNTKEVMERWQKNILTKGAESINSNDAWAMFFESHGDKWLFTSLSSVVSQPTEKASLIALDRFPDPPDVSQYLLPVRVMWAHAKNIDNRIVKKLMSSLADADFQETLARISGLIPANIKASPSNPPAMQAKRMWLSSTHVFLID